MITKLYNYISQNQQALYFVTKYPVLSADNFFKFGEEYYSRGTSAGSKFSERVFTKWIYESVADLDPRWTKQSKLDLLVQGVQKQVDLQLVLNGIEFLIEFKCNIDMIEKDIFKFIYLKDQTPQKLIFIWEYIDNSQSVRNGDSSYLRILDYFEKNNGINYYYFPLRNHDKTPYDGNNLQQKIDSFINYLRSSKN